MNPYTKSRFRKWLRAVTGLLLFCFVLAPTLPVRAHASLLRSIPETGAVLDQAPTQVRLEFSEPLDPGFTRARLVDAHNQVVVEGPGRVAEDDPLVLLLDLPVLPAGAYSVIWQARSTVDGHITQGSVTFAVGRGQAVGSLLPPPGAPSPAQARPPLPDTLLRALSYLFAALLVGSLTFALLVWRPVFHSEQAPPAAADQSLALVLRRLALTGALGWLLISVLFIIFQAWQARQGPFGQSFLSALLQLVNPHNASIFYARLLLLGLVLPLARRLSPPGGGPVRPWIECALFSLGALLTVSLSGHSAAAGAAWAVLLDWLHLAAMGIWLGGLLPLFFALRTQTVPAWRLVGRFSLIAVSCVLVLAASGLGSALLHVGGVDALQGTLYGRTLIIKLGIFSLLMVLGALNLLVLRPRLKDQLEKAGRILRTSIRLELVLGLLVLLAAGVLTGAAPALEALNAERRLGYVGAFEQDNVRLKLWVAPARAGDNEIAVDVQGDTGGQGEVILRLRMLDHEMGIAEVPARADTDGRYLARGSYLSMAGNWQIEVILRRPGQNDLRQTFDLQVLANPNESTRPNPVPASAASIRTGEALYSQNCAPCHGVQGKGDGPAGMALNPRPGDLTVHAAPGIHTDGQLFEWISGGFPGSAMPAFEELLTEEERWHLVNYIRSLAAASMEP